MSLFPYWKMLFCIRNRMKNNTYWNYLIDLSLQLEKELTEKCIINWNILTSCYYLPLTNLIIQSSDSDLDVLKVSLNITDSQGFSSLDSWQGVILTPRMLPTQTHKKSVLQMKTYKLRYFRRSKTIPRQGGNTGVLEVQIQVLILG